jgi:tRNA-specific 2-thiouridylase
MKKIVAVAMSGGVDSSLTAALLLEQGYEVFGMTMRLWDTKTAAVSDDTAVQSAVRDAKKIADLLGIPHYTMDFRDFFASEIMPYFVEEYQQGNTPNPCVKCNKLVKFGRLFAEATALGADYVATGHYAGVMYNEERKLYELHRGQDKSKDQSYVLYNLNQQTLPHFLFPLGHMVKENTRLMAKARNLPVFNKPESQDICFIPDNNYKRFLRSRVPKIFVPGDIVTKKGNVLGQHKGLSGYTIGQRRGLGIAASEPLYVVAMDVSRNQIIVSDNEQDLYSKEVWVKQSAWVESVPTDSIMAKGKIRYAAKESPCCIYPQADGKSRVIFEEAQRAVTPGQSLVWYQDDRVIGGGVIIKQ